MMPELVEDEGLGQKRDPTCDFAVKDTWRVFRIMGGVRRRLRDAEPQIPRRVTIFGSAR